MHYSTIYDAHSANQRIAVNNSSVPIPDRLTTIHQAAMWAAFSVRCHYGRTWHSLVSSTQSSPGCFQMPFPSIMDTDCLTFEISHWGRVTHICVSNLTIIGSDNGLSPGRCQAIIWTNPGILLFLIRIQTFSLRKCTWKCRLRNGVHFISASMWYT